MKSHLSVAIAALAASNAALAQQKTAIPAFFPIAQQTDASKGYDWMRIANAGAAVLAVVPDDSFRGLSGTCEHTPPPDTYCGPCSPPCTIATGASVDATGLCQAKCQFVINHNAGQLVLAYQNSDFACHLKDNYTTAQVHGLVDNLYIKYQTQIQGIFYDDGPALSCPTGHTLEPETGPAPSQQNDYHDIYCHVHNNYGSSPYTGNTVMLNASQFPHDWIVTANHQAADLAIIFEGSYDTWKNNYGTPPDWWKNSSYQGKLAHVVYSDGVHPTQNDVAAAVTLSRNNSIYGSPPLYLFDGDSSGYNHVACFFEQEVAALQNQPPVAGKTYCSGTCVDLNSDPNHCGSCTNVCSSGTCCLGTCCNLRYDHANCGWCGHDCGSGQCVSGACYFDCSTCACGCNAAQTGCRVRSCSPGYFWMTACARVRYCGSASARS